ncbi:MAG TPA: vitamin K epoxide reductase family protein [Longimicrobiales bacterium]|nr:vitamin K epoxide reductase family protein [Longimicrobiales bacterium]
MLNRMAIALFALVGVLISAYMTAYKLGLLGTIACGTGGCETVQNSPWAVFLGLPVPMIGLVGYGLLMVTALLGLQPRFEYDRRVAVVLLAAAVIGAAFSAYLTYLEATVIHAWCRWCIVSAVLAGLILLFSVPELTRLRAGGDDLTDEVS